MGIWFWIATVLYLCGIANVVAVNTSADGVLDPDSDDRSTWKSNVLLAIFWPVAWILMVPDIVSDARKARRPLRR